MDSEDRQVHRIGWRPLITAGVLFALTWFLRQPLMLIFGAVLFAVALKALAWPLTRYASVGDRLAIGIVVLLLLALLFTATWFLGQPVLAQLTSLVDELPAGLRALRGWLEHHTAGLELPFTMNKLSPSSLPLVGVADIAGFTVETVSALVLIVIMGVYLALDIERYKSGLVLLVRMPWRPGFDIALQQSGEALTRWLMGQGLTMVAVGTSAFLGLFFLGAPLPIALGLITALLEFIPFLGPIASGLLAVLLAFVQGPEMAVYVALLFLLIQQIEGNVLVPIIQRWAVHIPPFLSVASVLIFGTLFGLLGIILATPLMVVVLVMVRRLWIGEVLEGRRKVQGTTQALESDH